MKDTLLLAAVALVVVILIILTIKVRRTRRTKVSESWSSVTKEEFLSILLGTYSAQCAPQLGTKDN
jgi:ABC-type sulfate transport system permease component